jgi:hypothetical protein
MIKQDKKPEYYEMIPVYTNEGGIASAACVICMATGKILSGMGGPGRNPIAPEIVEALKNTGVPKMIITEAEFQAEFKEQLQLARNEAFEEAAELAEHAYHYAKSLDDLPSGSDRNAAYAANADQERRWSEPMGPNEIAEIIREKIKEID